MEKRGGGFVWEKHLKSRHVHLGKVLDEFPKKYGVDHLGFGQLRFHGSATSSIGVFDPGQIHGYFLRDNRLVHSEGSVELRAVWDWFDDRNPLDDLADIQLGLVAHPAKPSVVGVQLSEGVVITQLVAWRAKIWSCLYKWKLFTNFGYIGLLNLYTTAIISPEIK